MKLTYKLTEDGKAVVLSERGFPVVIDEEDNNKELPIDAIHLYQKVPSLTNELKQLKETHQGVVNKFAPLGEVDDVDEFVTNARKAMETVANYDQKKLVDAGEVEAIKRQAQDHLTKTLEQTKQAYETELQKREDTIKAHTAEIYRLMVTERFNTSNFVKEKLSITPVMARKYFGEAFKVEESDNGRNHVIGYFPDGEKIFSRVKAGEIADFDEALEILVDKDPDRDIMLAGSVRPGSGGSTSERNKQANKIEELKAQYEEAGKRGDYAERIRIKNQLHREYNINLL